MSGVWAIAAVAAAVLGLGLLRAAWTRRGGALRTTAGWLLLAAAAVSWRATGPAWDKAIALAALTPSLVALTTLALGAEVAGARARKAPRNETVVELPVGVPARWTNFVRFLLAGPLAGAAALGVATLVALRAPWVDADRLVAAGFLLPLGWAAGCIWATTDTRPLRVAAGLAATTALAFAGAML